MNSYEGPDDRFALRQLLPCHFSRKRSRTCDDNCEFTPISKRINNLHIRSCLLNAEENAGEADGIEHTTCRCSETGQSSEYPLLENGVLPGDLRNVNALPEGCYVNLPTTTLMADAASNVHYIAKSHPDYAYEPELSATENPHYYQANGLLFNCHIHRLQRATKVIL